MNGSSFGAYLLTFVLFGLFGASGCEPAIFFFALSPTVRDCFFGAPGWEPAAFFLPWSPAVGDFLHSRPYFAANSLTRFMKSKLVDDVDAEQYRPKLVEVSPGHLVAEHDAMLGTEGLVAG